MKIEKYKKISKNRYRVIFDNSLELILYEDIILKNNLLTKKNIKVEELDKIVEDNGYYEAYDISLTYLEHKLRTEKEIEKKLVAKEIDQNIIKKTINKLKQDGFLDSRIYVKAFINDKINLTNDGPIKIQKELTKKGIEENIIQEQLNNIEESFWNKKLNKLINKKISLNKKLSNKNLELKLIQYFINLGYSRGNIIQLIHLEKEDPELVKQELRKVYKKYEQKYSGKELDYKVKNEMYKKGFYNL